jgi:hypothetical protein
MGTKNDPGKYDCYAKAEPDEPIFTLIARDRHAPTLIWLWSTLRELDQDAPEKVAEAREVCAAMLQWQIDRGRLVQGLGAAALAAVFELIRMANYAVKAAGNEPTGAEKVRAILAYALVDAPAGETPA